MCGICGVITYNNNIDGLEKTIKMMCDKMVHRGPDEEGIYLNSRKINSRESTPKIGLGHRRLKVIDLSGAGHQPMSNEDGTVWIVFNGEVYNYKQLREDLKKRGHKFKSNTDTEVIIHLYEDFGEGCLSYLRGMFAFAIWDEKQDKLFLARDRIGKKPILYYRDNQYFCFASEFRALLASGFIEKDINYEGIGQYLTFGYVPAPGAIYKKVFKILPAHFAILQNGELMSQKYWDMDYSRKINISEKDASRELIRLLREAVRMRLDSDVPLGAFLSGGIDSSTVVALMAQLTDKVKTFSIGFTDSDFDELKYARNVARRFSTDHHEFVVKPQALKILPLLVEHYGEPYADSSCIPTFYVSQQTKQYVTVALNGDGGDESFAGYERYQAMRFAESYNRFPVFFRDRLSRAIMLLLPDSVNFKNRRRRIRRFFENASNPFFLRYCRWVSMINDAEKNDLFTEEFKMQLNNKDAGKWLADYPDLPEDMDLVDRLMAIDIKTNLANDLLVKMDIASMANSLETRSPFLDQEVMQFAASLPGNFKLRGFIKKYILKKSIEDLIPSENINRPKMGFGVPVGRWFRAELKSFVVDTLLSGPLTKRPYFKPDALKAMVYGHIAGKRDYSFQIWTLLMLELWHRRFID